MTTLEPDIEYIERNESDLAHTNQLLDEFLDHKKRLGKSISLIKNYRYDILHFLRSCQKKNLELIIVEDVEDYISLLRMKMCANSTINRRLCAIKSFYSYLRKQYQRILRREKRKDGNDLDYINSIRGLIEEYDDIIGLESIRTIKNEKLPFSISELQLMLQQIKNPVNSRYENENTRNYLIIKFSAIATGARNTAVRELLTKDLTCNNCDKICNQCIPTVRLTRKGKKDINNTKVRVRIEKETCKELKSFIDSKKDDDPVFGSRNGDSLSIGQMNRILQKAMVLAEIEVNGRSFHSLRHTFITEGIKNGTPWGHMMIQVDHKAKLGITGQYEHLQPEDLDIRFPKLSD